jgi:hypothetical protein
MNFAAMYLYYKIYLAAMLQALVQLLQPESVLGDGALVDCKTLWEGVRLIEKTYTYCMIFFSG